MKQSNADSLFDPSDSSMKIAIKPSSDWIGRESFTTDFRPDVVPNSRRGNFAYEVALAEKQRLISPATAALWLNCKLEDYLQYKGDRISLFE